MQFLGQDLSGKKWDWVLRCICGDQGYCDLMFLSIRGMKCTILACRRAMDWTHACSHTTLARNVDQQALHQWLWKGQSPPKLECAAPLCDGSRWEAEGSDLAPPASLATQLRDVPVQRSSDCWEFWLVSGHFPHWCKQASKLQQLCTFIALDQCQYPLLS